MKLLVIAGIAAVLALPNRGTGAVETQTDPSEEDSAKNVRQPDRIFVYRTTPQGELKMHMYLPKNWKAADKRPAILFFHGGGWSAGKASQFYSRAGYFAGRGLVTLSAEYRVRDPHGVTPEKCHTDARSAMRYVRSHAAELGVDPERIVAAGSSAGANLAMSLAILSAYDDPADDLTVSCRPQAIVAYAPCTDVSGKAGRWRGTPDEARGKELAMSLSLLHHVTNGCPPTIILQGTADVYLPKTREFVKKSLACGNKVELYTAPDMPHSFHSEPPWFQTTTIAVDRFLGSLGYLDGEPTMKSADDRAILTKEAPEGK